MTATESRSLELGDAATGSGGGSDEPMRGPRRKDRVWFRLPVPAWVALGATVVLLAFAGALAFTYGSAADDAVQAEASEAHDQWVEAGVEVLGDQTTAAEDVLRRTYNAALGEELGSEALLQRLLAAGIADENDFLPFQLVGVGDAAGQFSGVGISPAAGQIGVASAGEGTMKFRPWDGGVPTELGGWTVTDRDWYVAGVTFPDQVQFVGPSVGLDGKTQFVVTMAEPAVTGRVWMASLPAERVARLVSVAFPSSSRFHSATAVVWPADPNSGESREVELFSTPDGAPEEVLRTAAADLGDRNEHTSVLTDSTGERWEVTAGRALPGNENLLWVLASPADPAIGIDGAQYLMGALLIGLLLVGVATVASVWTRRSLRRVATACETLDGATSLRPGRERVTEIGEVAAAAQAGANTFRSRYMGAEHRETRLQQLHLRFTQEALEERRRAARDLHDGPLQTVIAAGLTLPPDSVEAGYLTSAQAEMRRIADELVADELGPGGLPARLAQVADEASDGRRFVATVEGPEVVDVSPQVGEVILRAARELLVNARKHSGAASATAHLAATESLVRLTVTDDGVGFSATESSPSDGGFGLFSLQVQVEQLGGSVTVNDGASGGAKVVVSVPLHGAVDTGDS